MKRRDFIKALATVGGVAITSPILSNITQLEYYPEFDYKREFSYVKMAWLHNISGTNAKGEDWIVSEYTDDKQLDLEVFSDMVDVLVERLTNG